MLVNSTSDSMVCSGLRLSGVYAAPRRRRLFAEFFCVRGRCCRTRYQACYSKVPRVSGQAGTTSMC